MTENASPELQAFRAWYGRENAPPAYSFDAFSAGYRAAQSDRATWQTRAETAEGLLGELAEEEIQEINISRCPHCKRRINLGNATIPIVDHTINCPIARARAFLVENAKQTGDEQK